MRKSKYLILLVMMYTLLFSGSVVHAESLESAQRSNVFARQTDISNIQKITPRSDIIGWRYKTVGDSIYKRQYNYSKQAWIGNWVLCP